MKKLLTSVLLVSILNLASIGQILIPNKTTFTQDNSTYSNGLNAGTATQTVNNNNSLECSFGDAGGWIIYDLEIPRKINQIGIFCNNQPPSWVPIKDFEIETAPSITGPWTTVLSTTFVISGPGGQVNFPFTTKTSRYWRFKVLNVYGTPPHFNFVCEFYFYKENDNLIITNGSCTLQEDSCVTLTAGTNGESYLWSTGETTQSITACNTGVYTLTVTNSSFTGNQDHTASISISKVGSQDSLWAPNGPVYSVYRNANNIYIGGNFNYVGPITGSGVKINSTSAIHNPNLPRIDGVVNCVIPDGAGGWYVGGTFSHIGNFDIKNLAHINSDNTLDINFVPQPNNTVNTLLIAGSNLYVGGLFTSIQSLAVNYFSKINRFTGAPNFWSANANGEVKSIQLYNDLIIVGGSFTSIGGATRNYLAAVDTNYVQATTWNPNPNATIWKVFVNGSDLYVGGDFSTISSATKNNIAAYILPAFTARGWNAQANGRVQDICANGSIIYVGGAFTSIGGASRNYIAALSNTNGIANTFNPNANAKVNSLTFNNSNLIVGGEFTTIGGSTRNRLAEIIISSSASSGWDPNVNGIKSTTASVNALAVWNNSIYAGGYFYSIGGQIRNNIACLDANMGSLTLWDPNANNIVRSIVADNNYVYLGGDFTSLNGTITKNRIAQVNVANSLPTGWNPNADNSVCALAISGSSLYVGGKFNNIGGASRTKIAALNINTGASTPFNPAANGNVNALCIGGDSLYIGGDFSSIGGSTRNRIAAYKISNSTLTAINPDVNNSVFALGFKNNKLFIGGNFTAVSSTYRSCFAGFNVSSNSLIPMNPDFINSKAVYSVIAADSSVYQGGNYQFSNNGYPLNNLTAIKSTENSPGYWQPQPNDTVRSLFLYGNSLYIGGKFTQILSRFQPFFASSELFITAKNPPTITNLSNTIFCHGDTLLITGTDFIGISAVKVGNSNVTSFTVISNTNISIVVSGGQSGVISIINPLGIAISSQNITVNPLPTAPSATTTYTYCQNATATQLTATGSNLLWYTVPANGSGSSTAPTPSTTSAGTTHYYVSQTISSCEGPRTDIAVTVNATPSLPTATTTYTYCQGATATQLSATGSNLLWYNVPTNGTGSSTVPTPSTTSAGTTHYYVSQTVSGCEGPRTDIEVTVNATPSLPTATTTYTYCQGATATQLSATGSNLLWYTVPTNGTGSSIAPTPSTANAGTTHYYVSQTISSCESPRTDIAVTVNATPSLPTATTTYTYCQNATATQLTATGSNLLWYTVPTNGTGSSTAPTPSTTTAGTTHYYVSQTVSGCEGPRTDITITVYATPPTPVITINSLILHSDAATGNQWYNQSGIVGGAATQDYTPLTEGDYYVIVTVNGCPSAPSNSINVVFTGIEQKTSNGGIKVYPNPVSDELTIEAAGNSETINFEIYNSVGQLVFKGSLLNKTIIQTGSFATGVYMIKLDSGKTFEFKKIIKE